MPRKLHKTRKSKMKLYTALVPKTLKASKKLKSAVIQKINYFLKNSKKTLKKARKSVDNTISKSLSSITKRRLRR
jgi:hypothetical protein